MRAIWFCRNTLVFLHFSFSVFGAHIFILPISQFLSPKLKGRRIKRKKNREI